MKNIMIGLVIIVCVLSGCKESKLQENGLDVEKHLAPMSLEVDYMRSKLDDDYYRLHTYEFNLKDGTHCISTRVGSSTSVSCNWKN